MSKIILMSELRASHAGREAELKFYIGELQTLTNKVRYLMAEVDLTKRIIDMIEHEAVPPVAHRVMA